MILCVAYLEGCVAGSFPSCVAGMGCLSLPYGAFVLWKWCDFRPGNGTLLYPLQFPYHRVNTQPSYGFTVHPFLCLVPQNKQQLWLPSSPVLWRVNLDITWTCLRSFLLSSPAYDRRSMWECLLQESVSLRSHVISS